MIHAELLKKRSVMRLFMHYFFFSSALLTFLLQHSYFGLFSSEKFEAAALVQVNIFQVELDLSLARALHNHLPSRCCSQLIHKVDLHISFGIGLY